MLWDLAEGKRLYSLEAGDIINALVFSPNRYWLCAATNVSCLLRLCACRYCLYVLVVICLFYLVLGCCQVDEAAASREDERHACLFTSSTHKTQSCDTTTLTTTQPTHPYHQQQQSSIKIWDLESKSVVDDLRPEFSKTYSKKAIEPYAISLAWSADGGTLFAGWLVCGMG